MVKVFSFCLYGGQEKYCRGLISNIKLIEDQFQDFKIYVYLGSDVPQSYIDEYKKYQSINLIETKEDNAVLMCHRYYPIDNPEVEIAIFRDCDSRVNQRDTWAIKQFIASDKKAHLIYDHYWHKELITGGTWAIKQGLLKNKIQDLYNSWIDNNQQLKAKYGTDQTFLSSVVYPMIKNDALVHSDIVGHPGVETINFPDNLYTNQHFIGNVYNFINDVETPQFTYEDYDLYDHVKWLVARCQWKLIIKVIKSKDIYKYQSNIRYQLLFNLYLAYYYLDLIDEARSVMIEWEYTYVDDHIILNSNYLIGKIMTTYNKKLIATFDYHRQPKDDEIVVCYGNFLHDYNCLPGKNIIYRHPIYFASLNHNVVEYHQCWSEIDRIYIINLPERQDRYYDVLVELTKMQAPLNKVYHYKARKDDVIKDNKQANIYWGATNNHREVVEDFINNNFSYCLILEDDFTFTSNIKDNQNKLKLFFDRHYDFDVCLISSSKYHDYKPYDDLLNLSYQTCTTTSGYLLNKKTAKKIYDCFNEGCQLMLQTKDYHKYVCDRYWVKIQKDNKFFVFKSKLGYQRPCYSSITASTNLNMD